MKRKRNIFKKFFKFIKKTFAIIFIFYLISYLICLGIYFNETQLDKKYERETQITWRNYE